MRVVGIMKPLQHETSKDFVVEEDNEDCKKGALQEAISLNRNFLSAYGGVALRGLNRRH